MVQSILMRCTFGLFLCVSIGKATKLLKPFFSLTFISKSRKPILFGDI